MSVRTLLSIDTEKTMGMDKRGSDQTCKDQILGLRRGTVSLLGVFIVEPFTFWAISPPSMKT